MENEAGRDRKIKETELTEEIQNTNQVNKTDISQEYVNWKERAYDHIPITLKTLDIIIFILIAILCLMFIFFAVRKFS